MNAVQDRVVGLLTGLAAGDRNGGPIRMALRVAESLSERGRFDLDDVASRYLDWWRHGAFDTGPTVAAVLERVSVGVRFDQAAARVDSQAAGRTAGCNPAHRSAPLAMCPALTDEQLAGTAQAEAGLTHRHPLAGDAAAAVAALCRALIRGADWSTAVDLAARGRAPETHRALTESPPGRLSPGGYAPEALGAAIHFLRTTECFADALAASIEFAGPANYSPVLVGSIGGARWGRAQVSAPLLDHHPDLMPRVTAAAFALAAQWPDR